MMSIPPLEALRLLLSLHQPLLVMAHLLRMFALIIPLSLLLHKVTMVDTVAAVDGALDTVTMHNK